MISPGKLLLRFYHQPANRLRDSWRMGGPIAQRRTERERREMEAAAEDLPPLPQLPGRPAVALHLLTGRRFWYQTRFCLHSFASVAQVNVRAEIYDDGSIDALCRTRLAKLGPGARLHPESETRAKLDALLPADRFPVLRERWQNYPILRKLIDVHIGSSGWKLVADSDALFFRRPELLLRWLARPDRTLYTVDCRESYGYSRPLLERLAGAPIPPLVNIGLCGLLSEALDWEKIEAWCSELILRESTNYYMDQALVAMLAAGGPAPTIAPADDYITRPEPSEVMAPRAVMHHYVDNAKRWYFRYGWRHFVSAPVDPPAR